VHLYFITSTLGKIARKFRWSDARAHCQGLGRDLVSIHSQQDQDEIQAVIVANEGTTTAHWIGLSDQAREGTYVWSDGTSGSYRNWYPGDPSGREAADCVLMYSGNYQYQWGNYRCSGITRPFLCAV